MAVVSGPGSTYTWNKLLTSPASLCESNGLFEAIFTCCNYLFVDSATCNQYIFMETGATLQKNSTSIEFQYISNPTVKYFEHDTDCAIHQILSAHEELGILNVSAILLVVIGLVFLFSMQKKNINGLHFLVYQNSVKDLTIFSKLIETESSYLLQSSLKAMVKTLKIT